MTSGLPMMRMTGVIPPLRSSLTVKQGEQSRAATMLLIGNPGNRRTLGLQEARSRWGLKPAVLVTYLELLQAAEAGGEAISRLLASRLPQAEDQGLLIRLDAPGEQADVERSLIGLGAHDREGDDSLLPLSAAARRTGISAAEAALLPQEKGRITYPGQWFRGYCRLLAMISREVIRLWPKAVWVNAPEEVAVMFDKRACQQRLGACGIDIPRRLASGSAISCYEHMIREMEQDRMNRLFLKLATGSGASGVIAYQRHPLTGAEKAVTTIGIEQRDGMQILYNSGRLKQYADHATIRGLVDWLCGEGVHMEEWIPKAGIAGFSFDIRQLVVAGRACHRIARLSRSPITNLHLRNRRLAVEQTGLSTQHIERAALAAEAAMAAFPGSSVAGVDVLVRSGSRLPYIIDVNPFGDLLYGVLHEELNPYEWQMKP
ncbi:STM4014 family protein [Paenibacillus roseus]